MTVTVQCPDCGKAYNVRDESIGARANCKSCGATFTVSINMDDTGKSTSKDADSDKASEKDAAERSAHSKSSAGKAKGQRTSSEGSAKADREKVPKKLGNYVVQRKLGAGAMGVVYLGRDPVLDRQVAIKVLPASLSSDEERLKRFLREAKSAARLHHTNVAAVHQAGAEGRLAYIAMEYVEGTPLDKAVPEGKPMDWREATRVIRDAAAGLGAAHAIDLVHRDIKPGNLIQTKDGVTKVVDFGLARGQQTDTQLTQQGTLLGTPAYMAPEQWMGAAVDGRTDLYSLICTYYFLLTGHLPYDAPSMPALGYQHRYEAFPDPRERVPDLPDAICRILAHGSAKGPAERFQNADELVSQLEVLLACPEESLTFGSSWEQLGAAAGSELSPLEDPLSDGFEDLEAPAAALPTPKPSPAIPSPTPAWRLQVPLWVWVATAGLAALVMFGVVIVLSMKYGTVQITVHNADENVQITVDGDTIAVDGLNEPLKLKVGEHNLVASSPNFETVTQSFQVKEEETTVLEVTFAPKAIAEVPNVATPPADPAVHDTSAGRMLDGSSKQSLLVAPFDASAAKQAQQRWAVLLKTEAILTNSNGMKLACIPPGEFMMGSSESEEKHSEDEYHHRVRITKPFYLGVYEVTQGEYERLMGKHASHNSPTGAMASRVRGLDTSRLPVEMLSWEDMTSFCRKLSELPDEKRAGRVYRLPTEAEWEYACRAGTTTAFCHGDSQSSKDGNYAESPFIKRTTTVGSYKPNAFGLYDMHGNVWELCQDWYDPNYYKRSPPNDPTGPTSGASRVMRGGCYVQPANAHPSASRSWEGGLTDWWERGTLGFRVAMTVAHMEAARVPDVDTSIEHSKPGSPPSEPQRASPPNTAPDSIGNEQKATVPSVVRASDLPKGCVVAYSFDRDTIFSQGPKQYVRDLSGNDCHGLLNGVTISEGEVGTAAEFAGKPDSLIKLPDENGQYPANDFSIMAWVKGKGGTILNLNFCPCASSVLARSGGALFHFTPSQGGRADLSFVVRGRLGRNNNIQASDNSIPEDAWTHVAVTRKRDAVTFYINGKVDQVHSMPIDPIVYNYETYDSNAVTLGGCRIGDPHNFGHGVQSAAGYAYTGLIDEFALFDRALSEQEIEDICRRRAGG